MSDEWRVTGFGSVGFSLRRKLMGAGVCETKEAAALGDFSSTGIPACAGVETRRDRAIPARTKNALFCFSCFASPWI
jgi:hypothetical protein